MTWTSKLVTSSINEHKKIALDEFAFTVSVPLFCALDGGDANHLATGTFFVVEGKRLLLTARHIFEICKPEDISIPSLPSGSELRTLGKCCVHTPKDLPGTEIDIAAIELKEEKTIEIVSSGWRSVSLSMGDTATDDEGVMLVGFPSASLSKEGHLISGQPTAIVTSQLNAIPATAGEPVNPDADLFLDLSSEMLTTDGEAIKTPAIHGMSGCAIWQFREPECDQIWTPNEALRFVGIQSSAASGLTFLRGKRWEYVRLLLEAVGS